MMRVTLEILPFGDADLVRTIGRIEIANVGRTPGEDYRFDYAVAMADDSAAAYLARPFHWAKQNGLIRRHSDGALAFAGGGGAGLRAGRVEGHPDKDPFGLTIAALTACGYAAP